MIEPLEGQKEAPKGVDALRGAKNKGKNELARNEGMFPAVVKRACSTCSTLGTCFTWPTWLGSAWLKSTWLKARQGRIR